jgi:hypothetical protein
MRRVLLFAVLFLCAPLAYCQQTVVTAQVKDPSGNPYSFGTGRGSIVCPGNQAPTLNGFTVPRTITITGLDGNGSFTQTFFDTSLLDQTGCGTQFAITDRTGVFSFTTATLFSVTGASVNLSATISAYSVSLPTTAQPAGLTNNNTFTGNNTHSGTETFSKPVFRGPSPWYDVTSDSFGAKCDGSTDDTTAFNATIAAAQASGGGTVFVPVTTNPCVIASFLNMDNTVNVALIGYGGTQFPQPSFTVQRPVIQFTGNPSSPASYIRARSALGCRIEGLELQYTNASFAGNLIDLTHNGGDSQGCSFRNDLFTGVSTALGATCLINASNADNLEVDHSWFMWAAGGVCVNTTNGLHIHNSGFNNSVGTFSGPFIKGLGTGGLITIGPNVTFEMGNGQGSNLSAIDCTSGCPTMTVTESSIQDIPAAYAGVAFKNMPGATSFIANPLLFGGTSKLGTLVSTPAAQRGFYFHGGAVANWGTVFNFGGALDNIDIGGVDWSSGGTLSTTFLAGTTPNSGVILDQNNHTTVYNSVTIGSTGSAMNQAVSGSATLTFTAISAQTCQEQSITVTGAASGKAAFFSPAASLNASAGLSWSSWVAASNIVNVRVCNVTSGSLTPNAVTWNGWVQQ